MSLRYVGKSVPRVDALDKVTGKTKFAADITFPDLLHGKILFSRYPYARIIKIDASKAMSHAAVEAILTGRDIKCAGLYGYGLHDQPLLVAEGGNVLSLGDAVALVAAASPEAASSAADMIGVEYEELKPITTIEEARVPGAPCLHRDFPGNLCAKRELQAGDVDAAFRGCSAVEEGVFATPRVEQAFLEPEAGLAFVDDHGILQVHSCLQDPYCVAEDINSALGIPKNRIRVVGTPVGGGFGGKLDTTIQVHLAALALHTRKPVKMALTREESFLSHAKRHPCEIRIKMGADRDDKLLALEAEVLSDAGPYSGRTPEVLGVTVATLPGPYRIPNVRISGRAYYTNNLASGAFRGFGAPQAAIARECLLDRLAHKIGMNPLSLRKKNFLKEGDKPINPIFGESPVSVHLLAQKVEELAGKPQSPKAPWVKIGRGFGFDMPVFDIAAIPVMAKAGVGIAIEMNSDGSVSIFAGGTELGQGISTVLAQMAAEELGQPLEEIVVVLSDTGTSPKAGRTSASRLTYVLGNALRLAAEGLRQRLLNRAASMWECDPSDLVLQDGHIGMPENSKFRIDVRRVAAMCYDEGINLRQEAWYRYPEARYIYGHTFMASMAEVELDETSGAIRLLKLINVHDAGKVINPQMAQGQLEGGAIQALGYALMEKMELDKGYLRTPSFTEYIIPTAMDIPYTMVASFIETPYRTGPYGAKGLAEHALNSTTPAVLNAIFNAVRIPVAKVPFGPEELLLALRGGKSDEKSLPT